MQPNRCVFKKHNYRWTWLVIIFLLQNACKKDSQTPDYPAGTNENINTWMLDSLKRYYYWSDALPDRPDVSKAPLDFFAGIRNANDRFSYILLPGDPSTVTPSNKGRYGFDYATITLQGTDLVVGVIKLVLNDSPASRSGLKRGDYISKINNKPLTKDNALALQQELLAGAEVALNIADFSGSSIKDVRVVNLYAGFTSEQQSFSKIIDNGSTKTGYLYINDFTPGLAASLYNTFAGFKSASVSELILDLRYNSGGQVAEAAGLCAMIASGITYATPFMIYKGNKNGGMRKESIGDAATFDKTLNFNTLLQYNINLKRLFILGTGATASAAEVMINNLKPYMQVTLIGERTRGKDEASFKIFDARNPKKVEWEMHPIIYKLFNASGNGGYSAGITPDIGVEELSSLPLKPFGTTDDPLIMSSLARISGKSVASVSQLKQTGQVNLSAGSVLADTKTSVALASTVFTHR